MSSGYSLGAFLCLFLSFFFPILSMSQVWIGMILEIPPIGNLVFFTFSWLSASVNLNLPPHILLRMSAVALQLSSLPFLMRRMTLFVSLSSQVMLSMHGIIWFSMRLLCERCFCVCLCLCTAYSSTVYTRMPGTTERNEKEREISTFPPKALCLLTMQVSD